MRTDALVNQGIQKLRSNVGILVLDNALPRTLCTAGKRPNWKLHVAQRRKSTEMLILLRLSAPCLLLRSVTCQLIAEPTSAGDCKQEGKSARKSVTSLCLYGTTAAAGMRASDNTNARVQFRTHRYEFPSLHHSGASFW